MRLTTARIADAIERHYAALPPELYEAIDTLRDEIANALGIAGICSTTEFITRANTRRTPIKRPEDMSQLERFQAGIALPGDTAEGLFAETVVEALLRVGAVVSHAEGDRIVRGGGVYIDDVRQDNATAAVREDARVIRCGTKRAWLLANGQPEPLPMPARTVPWPEPTFRKLDMSCPDHPDGC